ncbi:hypothetical protein CDCA_CDCA07G2131 [Cyanidium caldarium]|uniref:RING-type E3 ubiquitin transferase n=1 Tax=Cyanidium caldarium TaxID=2771 RepID=A0AAV9IVC1_CYACA|nr:hypothetical protein CDCA_CDCA07G2131 [Cyanidium caldarium]
METESAKENARLGNVPSDAAAAAVKDAPRCSEGRPDDVVTAAHCSVCFEVWSTSGPHQLCCLRCGHMFGWSCLERWLRQQRRAAERSCPQCKQRASLADVRLLYVSCTIAAEEERSAMHYSLPQRPQPVRVLAREPCEKEALRRALLQERARRIELERELCRVREALTRPPVAPAREMVGAVAMPAEKEPGVAPAVTAADANASPSSRTRLEIRLVGSVTAGMRNCRVASFHAPTETLLVSTGDVGQAVAAAVDSYGLRRLCLQRPSDASPPTAALHRAPIRDLAAQDALLACVSLDGQMTLVHATSLAVVARVATGRPLWSVAFASPPQPHAIALGTADATVLLYDTRKLDAAVQRYKPAGGCGGAHSLQTLSMGQAGVCVRITEATLQSLSSTQLSGEGDGARQETLWSQSVATPSQCYSMRCRNGYRLASYRGGSGAYHLLAQVNTDGCDAEAVTRANGFVPGPCLDRTDFWMPAADASRAVIFSGDAQHPNAVAYWTAGATSPQHFRGLASTAEAVRSVVCSDAHPLLAVVQSGAVQVLRWRCEDV